MKLKKAKICAVLSTEAEYIVISDVCQNGVDLRGQNCEITNKINIIGLFNDNHSVQKLLGILFFTKKLNIKMNIKVQNHLTKEFNI